MTGKSALFWPLICAALAAYLAFPRLSHSLWTDEVATLIGPVHGSFERDFPPETGLEGDPQLVWESPSWTQTIWTYDTTNHHFLCSIVARLSLDTWKASRSRESWEFDETALRLVPFFVGLLGFLAWWKLALRAAGTGPAMVLTALLAIHPWVLRFLTEVRGYAYVFLFFPLLLLAMMACLRNSQWRDWFFFGLLQFLTVYSWPGMAPVLVVLNLALLVRFLVAKRHDDAGAHVRLKRWTLTNLATVSILAILVVPAIPQIIPFLQDGSPRQDINFYWWPNLFASFFGGMDWWDWHGYGAVNAGFVSMERLLDTRGWFLVPCMALFVFFGTAGWLSFFRRKRDACLLATSVCALPAVIVILLALATGIYPFPAYFFHLLPPLLLCVASGLWTVTGRFNPQWKPWIAALWIGAMFFALWPKTSAIRSVPLEALRESVVEVRGEIIDPRSAAQRGVMVAHIEGAALPYDPLGWYVDTDIVTGPDMGRRLGLVQLMSRADRNGAELYVIGGYRPLAKKNLPAIMRWLDNKDAFTQFKTMHGTEAQTVRHLYHYKGGFFDALR